MYIHCKEKVHVAGYFSVKLKQEQNTWLPCKIENWCIATSLQHFSPFLIQSHHKSCILTDSKICVQAHGKLLRGQFSHSSRVSTFLSTASCFAANIQLLAGSSNVPSDFASGNGPECLNTNCQICNFMNKLQAASVHLANIDNIIQGKSNMPFITRPTWLSTKAGCPHLRRVYAYLSQTTCPSKKLSNMKDMKRYLNCWMLVVSHHRPFSPTTERFVVARHKLAGLLTTILICLDHSI